MPIRDIQYYIDEALKKERTVSEASERELLAERDKLLRRVKIWKMQAERVEASQAALIAELRGLVQYDQSAHEYYPITAEKIWAVLDEYEVKE
jgi:hypothetical protein